MTTQEDIRATATAFNARHGWDTQAAIDLAREVMTDANAHAEVRLFDAAPELLAALQEVTRWVEYDEMCGNVGKATTDERLKFIRAAIAKAKGAA